MTSKTIKLLELLTNVETYADKVFVCYSQNKANYLRKEYQHITDIEFVSFSVFNDFGFRAGRKICYVIDDIDLCLYGCFGAPLAISMSRSEEVTNEKFEENIKKYQAFVDNRQQG